MVLTKRTPTTSTNQSELSYSETESCEGEEYGRWTGYHPVVSHYDPPSLETGYAIIAAFYAFLLLGVYATFLSAFFPATGWKVLDVLASDSHYKYFIVLLVPTTAYFVIANWVGWQFYRNS